jgi:hypothetical protein
MRENSRDECPLGWDGRVGGIPARSTLLGRDGYTALRGR